MAIGVGASRRLGIPRVDPNPRPPNERRAAVARRIAVRPIRPAVAPAQVANPRKPPTVPSVTTQTTATPTPANQPVTATPIPQTSTSPFHIPSYNAQAGQPDPRDATYWANLNKLLFTANQEYGQSLQEQTMADTAYQAAAQEALRNRAVQQRTLGENAIRSNLSASGWLNRNETEQTTEYTSQRAQAALTKSQEDQARLTARQALAEGFSIDAAAELAAAGARAAERAELEAEGAAGEAGGGSGAGYAGPSGYMGTGMAKAFSKKLKPKIGIGPGRKAK